MRQVPRGLEQEVRGWGVIRVQGLEKRYGEVRAYTLLWILLIFLPLSIRQSRRAAG